MGGVGSGMRNKNFTVEVQDKLNYQSHLGLTMAIQKIPYQDRRGALGYRLLSAGEAKDGRRQLTIQATFK